MSDKIFFHVLPENIIQNKFELSQTESHHFNQVLRKSVGAEIWLTDGISTVYKTIVDSTRNGIVSGRIIDKYPKYGENVRKINLGIGILKRDKMEFVVEKATECGINTIFPIIMDHSIKRNVNIERLNKIALSAIKQCGRSALPRINDPILFDELINNYNGQIFAFHESGENFNKSRITDIKNNEEILLLIGPEGDFSDNEFEQLKLKKAAIFNLGNRRLRSETAVIVAISQVNQLFN